MTESTQDLHLESRLSAHFDDSITAKRATQAVVLPELERAGRLMAACLANTGRVLSCGNGGSAADAQHFSAELTNRFERERRPLAGIALTVDSSALTSIGNDYDFSQVFSKQVEALGRHGDILLAISTSGNSNNVVKAIAAARAAGMRTVALTGRDGGEIAPMLGPDDVELRAVAERTMRVQEVHLVFMHALCDIIDEVLFPA